jgi:putative protein kinase ArgK-like GTPase of G3E family
LITLRKKQTESWLTHLFHQTLNENIKQNKEVNKSFNEIESEVINGKLTAREGALKMIKELKNNLIMKS